MQKQAATGDKSAKRLFDILSRYKSALEQGKSARTVELDKEDRKLVYDLHLLTDKPVLYVCNVDEKSAVGGNAHVEAVRGAIREENAELLIVAAATEADIAELDTYEERQMFLEEVGLKESGVNRLIRAAYSLLNLETYFTTGPDETRAWTYAKGTKAPQAAGIIHTDFERGFIRAEVIKYDDYVRLGSEKRAARRVRSPSKARSTSYRTAISCISCSTCRRTALLRNEFINRLLWSRL